MQMEKPRRSQRIKNASLASKSTQLQLLKHSRGNRKNNKQPKEQQPNQLDTTYFRVHTYNSHKVLEVKDLQTGSSAFTSKRTTKYVIDDFNQIQKLGSQLVNTSPHCSSSASTTEWNYLQSGDKTFCLCHKPCKDVSSCECYLANRQCSQTCFCNGCLPSLKKESQETVRYVLKVAKQFPDRDLDSSYEVKCIGQFGHEQYTGDY